MTYHTHTRIGKLLSQLATVIILTLMFTNCSDDLTVDETIVINNKAIASRSGSHDCNIVLNGDFEDGIEGRAVFLDNGNSTVSLVEYWKCHIGSADLIGPQWSWSDIVQDDFWINNVFNNITAFLCTGNNDDHHDSNKAGAKLKKDIEYSLSYDYSSTAWRNK